MDYRKKAIKKLLDAKQEDVATFEILELYLTHKITVDKEEYRRESLSGIQKKIEETTGFIEFIKTLK